MTREEFSRRFRAVQREESRKVLVLVALFFAAMLVPCILWWNEPESAWIGVVVMLDFAAAIVVSLCLAERYFRNRPRRFGFVCPNCGEGLRGIAGLVHVSSFQCPACGKSLYIDE